MKKIVEFINKRFFYKKSMRSSIYFIFILMALIEFVFLSVFFINYYSTEWRARERRDKEKNLEITAATIEGWIAGVERVSGDIYFKILTNNFTEMDDKQLLINYTYDANSYYIESISLFNIRGEAVLTAPNLVRKSTVDVRKKRWFKAAFKEKDRNIFTEPEIDNIYWTRENQEWVIPVARYVRFEKNGEDFEGILLINLRLSRLSEVFMDMKESENEYTYAMDSKGDLLIHPFERRIVEGFMSENNKEINVNPDGYYEGLMGSSRKVCIIKTMEKTGWRVVSVYPLKSVEISIKQQALLVFWLNLFLAGLFLAINCFTAMITNPISRLEEGVKKVASGNLDSNVETGGSSEVISLGLSVRRMVERIKILMESVVKEQEEKRKTELESLQYQINPHFLYNTLDIITWMIELKRNDEATEVVSALAKLFRISISKGKSVIRVADEIEHIRNYLLIEGRRYKNSFSYQINCDENVKELATVKLVLQPLVENAINHAMKYLEDEGELEIRAYREGDDLYLSVIDNGPGMTEEQISRLINAPVSSERGSGIGVYNVNKRITLYFGMEYGIIIESEPDEGTKVTIHMPAIEYESYLDKNMEAE